MLPRCKVCCLCRLRPCDQEHCLCPYVREECSQSADGWFYQGNFHSHKYKVFGCQVSLQPTFYFTLYTLVRICLMARQILTQAPTTSRTSSPANMSCHTCSMPLHRRRVFQPYWLSLIADPTGWNYPTHALLDPSQEVLQAEGREGIRQAHSDPGSHSRSRWNYSF